MNLSELKNRGIEVLGEVDNSSKRPIVVVGVARGGTSLVAGVLEKLGAYMGDKATQPVFEDTILSAAIEQDDMVLAKQIISDYCTPPHHFRLEVTFCRHPLRESG